MTLIRAAAPKGFSSTANRAVRRYFEPSLAALIIEDRKNAARHGEVGKLDGDPFIDAQDWNIDKFDIEVADTGPGKAKATVKFVNLDQPATIVLDLVKIKNDWHISDITWLRDGKPQSLRGLLATKAQSPAAKPFALTVGAARGFSVRTQRKGLERVKGIEPSS